MAEKQRDFFEKRSVIATFGILALLGGIYFASSLFFGGNVTGNIILPEQSGLVSIVPTIGLLLLICSAILIVYAIVKKE
jgi:hypothetical protein